MSLIKLLTKLINIFPFLGIIVNRIASNKLSSSTKPRPHAYSLWSPKSLHPGASPSRYLSWHTVTDKKYFDLHLKPIDHIYINQLPSNEPTDTHPFGEVTALFKRREGKMKPGRSIVFFMFFAQWFTDGFFRSDHHDFRKTTSNHNIDLAQIYGANEEVAYLLRSGEGGRLSSQFIKGEEYLDFLGEVGADGKWKVKEKYLSLPYIEDTAMQEDIFGQVQEEKRRSLFATGLERSNMVVGHIAKAR